MPAGVLSIDFVGNTGPLAKSVQQAKQSLSGFKGATAGAMGGLSSMAAQAAATAGAFKLMDGAIGLVRTGLGGLASAFTTGIGLAAAAEQAQISFEVMLGSVDKAKAMLGEIRTFAAATPFESPELIDAAKSLLQMGINAKEVVPTLRMLGDAASASGKPIGNLAAMYGKMSVTGRVMGDDLNQLADAQVPVYEMLAKSMGVPRESLRKLAEQGKISFSYLRNGFIDLTSEGGKLAGMTAKQGQSLTGLYSTLKDNVGLTLQQIGEQAAKSLNFKGLVSNLSEAIDAMQGPMTSLLTSVGEGFGNMATDATGSTEAIIHSMKAAAGAMAYVGDQVMTLVNSFRALQIEALSAERLFTYLVPGGGDRRQKYDTKIKQMEDDLAKSYSKGSLVDQSTGFFDKALSDLQNKRYLQQQEGPAKPPEPLAKAPIPVSIQKDGILSRAGDLNLSPLASHLADKLFPGASLLGDVAGLMARSPYAKTLNKRLAEGGFTLAGGIGKSTIRPEYRPVEAAIKGSAAESSILNKTRFDFENRVQSKVEDKMLDNLVRIFRDVHEATQMLKKPKVLDLL